MFRNFMLASINNVKANQWSYLGNTLGLSVAFAFFILAMAYVHYETHYDHWVPNHERIYRISSEEVYWRGGEAKKQSHISRALLDYINEYNPEVQETTWLTPPHDQQLLYSKSGSQKSSWVSAPENFAQFWNLPIIEGQSHCPEGANCALISASLAKNIFGDTPAIGEQLWARSWVTIIGIYKDIPGNSHLAFDFIRIVKDSSNAYVTEQESPPNNLNRANLYVKLKGKAKQKKNVFIDAGKYVAQVFTNYSEKFYGQYIKVEPSKYFLEPLDELHLSTSIATEIFPMKTKGDNEQVQRITAAATLLLLIAAFNFSGLLLSQSFQRLREMALRKLCGSSSQNLLILTCFEIAGFVIFSFCIGLLLAHLLSPAMMQFFGIEISLSTVLIDGLYLWLACVSIILILLAFIMPAWSILHLKPADIFSGVMGNLSRNTTILFSFVTLQFVIALLVILGAITVGLQYKESAHKVFAANIENTLAIPIVPLHNLGHAKLNNTLAEAIDTHPSVNSWTISSVIPTGDVTTSSSAKEKNVESYRAQLAIQRHQVDARYFDLFQVKPLAGRLFSHEAGDYELAANITQQLEEFQQKKRQLIAKYKGHIPKDVREKELMPPFWEPNIKRTDYTKGVTLPIILNKQALKQLGFLSASDALGKTLAIKKLLGPRYLNESGIAQVIGVTPNLDHRWSPGSTQLPAVYFPGPLPFVADGGMITIKWNGLDREGLFAHIKTHFEIHIKPILPMLEFKTHWLEDGLRNRLNPEKRRMQIFMIMAGLVIFISMLGMHYAVQFTARQMRREMTIRKVFGTSPKAVIQRIIWTFTKPVLLANLIAWPIGYYLINQWLAQYADRISMGPGIFISTGLISLFAMLVVVGGTAYRMANSSPADDLAAN